MATAIRRTACSILTKRKFLTTSRRETSTDEKVLTSVFNKIQIPNYTIDEYVWQNLDRWPDKTLTVCATTGHGYTYAQTHRMSVCFAASLRMKLKLMDGDKVAVLLPNIPEYPCTALGIIEAGCVPVMLNPAYTAVDLKPQLEIVKCKAIVTSKVSYPNVIEALKQMKLNIPIILIEHEDIPEGAIKFAEFAEDFAIDTNCLKSVKRSPKDVAILPFSSGTSGFPKAVELTHRSMVALNEMIFDPNVIAVEEATESYQSVIPAVLPFFHIYGFNVIMMNLMSRGAKLVTTPVFKPDIFLETITKHRVRNIYVVPPMAMFLAKHPAVTPSHLESLREIICGAAPLSSFDAENIIAKNKKITFRQGYGLTETNGAAAITNKDDGYNFKTCGHLLGSNEAKIVALNTQETLGPGQEGEIWLRGPNLMKGYYDNKEATDESMTSDGWMKTGDIGKYDENKYLTITDRKKELIKVKGFQVAPAELETILRTHPKIADCAILGIPDSISGEVPKAFIVSQGGHSVSAKEIMEYVNSKVVHFKSIKEVQFIDKIPKNAAGKILKRVLKQKYVN